MLLFILLFLLFPSYFSIASMFAIHLYNTIYMRLSLLCLCYFVNLPLIVICGCVKCFFRNCRIIYMNKYRKRNVFTYQDVRHIDVYFLMISHPLFIDYNSIPIQFCHNNIRLFITRDRRWPC